METNAVYPVPKYRYLTVTEDHGLEGTNDEELAKKAAADFVVYDTFTGECISKWEGMPEEPLKIEELSFEEESEDFNSDFVG